MRMYPANAMMTARAIRSGGVVVVTEPTTTKTETVARRTSLARRDFLKLATLTAAAFMLPDRLVPALAETLAKGPRPPVIWLSFQECTGCTESLTRAHAPALEDLLFDYLSLDYHHTLQAASGEAAEAARHATMAAHAGRYLLIVDGSVPVGLDGAASTIAGVTNLAMLRETEAQAAAIIAIGTCAAYGGLAAAAPNPTGAMGVGELMAAGNIAAKPLVNLPGCPPLPVAIAGTLAFFLAFGQLPPLDGEGRPVAFYGHTVHEECNRYHHFLDGRFAESFDDAGARNGWCLLKLGCRGPVTRSACARLKWNGGVSFPVQSGHPCLGCAERGFWDQGGFYRELTRDEINAAATSVAAVAASDAGAQLYEDNCVYCHSADPNDFQREPRAVIELLQQGSIRAHRRFAFDDAQLADLEAYLQKKAGQP
jgi:hydrogenase small subunit